jgi:hypothetical protein
MDAMEPQPGGLARPNMGETFEDGWRPEEIGVLCRALFNGRFLPVLVLGPAGAGKTMMLASVINYFRANPHSLRVTVKIADFNLALNGLPFPQGTKMMEDAHRLFREFSDLLDTKVAPRTAETSPPFFMPIEIQDQNDLASPPIRLALMDGSGEHLNSKTKLSDGTDVKTPYGHLRPLVQGVLKDFQSSLACVFVLPHPPPNGDLEIDSNPVANQLPPLRLGDLSMENAIRQYQGVRPPVYQKYDSNLLVISQWDRQVVWQSVKFLAINKSEMLAKFRSVYQKSWGAFSNLAGKRAWMPYSSALVTDGGGTITTALARERLGIFSNRFVAWICSAYFSSFNSELRAEARRLSGNGSDHATLLKGVAKYFPNSLFGDGVDGKKPRGDDPAISLRRESEVRRRSQELAAAKAAADETAHVIERLRAETRRIDTRLDEIRRASSGPAVSTQPAPPTAQKSWSSMRLLMVFKLLQRIWDELFELPLAA